MFGEMLSIKTKDASTVELIRKKETGIVISGLNWLQDQILPNKYAFVVFGGDNPPWDTGLVGIAKIDEAPYDRGYDPGNPRNFKIKISVVVYFEPPIKRETLIPYPDTYGTIGIAPIVKWEPNQAITSVPRDKALALLQAIMELNPDTQSEISLIASPEEISVLQGSVSRFVLRKTPLGQPPNKDELAIISSNEVGGEISRNRIYFGAPGTGKSHQLEKDRLRVFSGENCERVTFYPTYSYSQFVGTYKPTMVDGKIEYAFVPGPFINIYIKALKNQNEKFLLILEELNRANAPAVFGDVFQLLDRLSDGSSEYPVIASNDLGNYLASQGINDSAISLPPNLYIWATMNSADQGVFPLDTAFKRRWDFEYLDVDTNETVISEACFEFTDGVYCWNDIRREINKKLLHEKINEDKLIGPFFIKPEILKNGKSFLDAFKSKVLMYLFEDAIRHRPGALFKENKDGIFSYSTICHQLDTEGLKGIFNFEIKQAIEVQTSANADDPKADE